MVKETMAMRGDLQFCRQEWIWYNMHVLSLIYSICLG